MSLLSIENVSKSYRTHKAVDNVSIHVEPQTIFGLLGPNGAGKTTLIRMITNILYQDTGNIILRGIKDVDRNMFIGYMPEERGLYKKMKVGEQLLYLAKLKNLSHKKAKAQIDYWFEKFDITDWWNKKVEELSKGMQQKIQFIATVVHDPKLIILDEPFSGLDPINVNLIKDQIFELKEKGATILFSTHRMEQVEEICEQIALINQGKVILQGDVAGLKQRFKPNHFRVNYSGDLPTLREEHYTVLEQQANELLLHLNSGYPANEMLLSLMEQGLQVSSFNEVLPSLNEIFISQVQAA